MYKICKLKIKLPVGTLKFNGITNFANGLGITLKVYLNIQTFEKLATAVHRGEEKNNGFEAFLEEYSIQLLISQTLKVLKRNV